MTLSAAPSTDEIVRLYKAGELAAELARYHGPQDDEDDLFIQRCVALHNCGQIDLVTIPSQPTFAGVTGHAVFTAQHLYCEAIPKLDTTATALMECCRILIERAGNDGAANLPNVAFRTWCQNNPSEGAAVIREARTGNELAKRFVTFAMQAEEDIDSAIDFVQSYADNRRLSGMAAFSGMTFANVLAAERAIAALEPFVADSGDDHVRANALLAAFDVLKKLDDSDTTRRLIDAATRNPQTQTLHALAQIVWLHHPSLGSHELRTALLALEAINPEHLGTVRTLDMGLRGLLGTNNEALVLDFLAVMLRDGKLTIKMFDTTAHELRSGNPQRLFEVIVRWFLSGSVELCGSVNELVGIDKNCIFDSTVRPLGLTVVQQIFLCRKAIGFLFLKPIVCCSIIVCVLRAGSRDVEGPVIDLLFDPILLSYGGDAKEYLKRILSPDSAYGPIQNALAEEKDYHAGLEATGTIKALHPSDYQRDVVHQRTGDAMHSAHKKAQSRSVLLNFVHRSTILYGRRTLTYIKDYDGGQRAVAMDLKSFGMTFEWPRREILDPVGLDYMLRMYRAERLK